MPMTRPSPLRLVEPAQEPERPPFRDYRDSAAYKRSRCWKLEPTPKASGDLIDSLNAIRRMP